MKHFHVGCIPIIQLIKALYGQSRGPECLPAGCLQGHLSLSSFRGCLNECEELLFI